MCLQLFILQCVVMFSLVHSQKPELSQICESSDFENRSRDLFEVLHTVSLCTLVMLPHVIISREFMAQLLLDHLDRCGFRSASLSELQLLQPSLSDIGSASSAGCCAELSCTGLNQQQWLLWGLTSDLCCFSLLIKQFNYCVKATFNVLHAFFRRCLFFNKTSSKLLSV